ncbi:MAG: hypothetical protein A2158_02735 [Chloroflexi bacterium RBG_13_46_14]|nr:MAG: hypothetical protein A2158_02735 [Chloroflexi bacterium RBG_13_46_14]
MARKAIVDKDIILELLRKGETTQRIAARFKVSRQAIDLHRKEFINKGLLPDKRAARTGKETVEFVSSTEKIDSANVAAQKPVLIKSETPPQENIESLDTHIDLIISAFNALKRLPVVEKELKTLKQENEKAKLEIERLKARENKRIDQEKRWMLINTEDIPGSPS